MKTVRVKGSQNGCRTVVQAAKRKIDRIVNQLTRKTGAEDVSIICFRQNGGFNCIITLSFGSPATIAKLKRKISHQ